MRTIGITGGIGSGKSTVCKIFRVLGIPVFEADTEGKALLNTDPEVRPAVIDRFGNEVYKNGSLDRNALATIVFSDPEALKDLNAIVHPAVRKAFAEWAAMQHAPYVIMEAALLVETGGHKYLDEVILVCAPKDLRIKRTTARDGVGEEAVLARMRDQATEDQRKAIADHVIMNDDSVLVIPQVLALHEILIQAS